MKSRWLRLLRLLVVMLLVLVGAAILIGLFWPLDIVWCLSTGWFRHLFINGWHWHWNVETIAVSLVCGVAGIWLLKRFIEGLRQGSLKWPSYLKTVAVVFASIAGAIAMSCVLHQFVWMTRGPVLTRSYNHSNLTMAINNGKQVEQALIIFDQDFGAFPSDLEELYRHKVIDTRSILFYRPTSMSRVREPWLYLQSGKKMKDLDSKDPVLLGFDRDRRLGVLICVNNAAETLSEEEYLVMLESMENGANAED